MLSNIFNEISSQLHKNLGLTLKPYFCDFPDYISKTQKLEYDLAFCGWIGDYRDPTTFLNLLKNDNNNRTGWMSQNYENLINKADTRQNIVERMSILALAEKSMQEEYPVINLFWYCRNIIIHPEVKGWKPQIHHYLPYKYMSIEVPNE